MGKVMRCIRCKDVLKPVENRYVQCKCGIVTIFKHNGVVQYYAGGGDDSGSAFGIEEIDEMDI